MHKSERGPYAKSVEVKRGILDACVTAFGESGFHGVSMAEIARRAHISHTGLLHHFPTKEALLTSVLTMQDARAAAFLQKYAEAEGDDPVVVVRGMLSSVTAHRHTVGMAELSAVLSAEASASTHPAHAHFVARYDAIRHFLARQFALLESQGRLNPALTPTELAAALTALVDGLQTQWLYAPGAVDIDAVLRGALSAFIPELLDTTPAPPFEDSES